MTVVPRRPVAAAVLVLVLAACGGPQPAPPPSVAVSGFPSEPLARTTVTLRGPEGKTVEVPVYVAAGPAARRRGLMGREELPAGAGMLFLFPEDTTGGFWMKDTLLPLSIAFAEADGRIARILDMAPCEADPCPVYEPGTPYRAALEANRGFFARAGVEPGWTLELPPDLPAAS